MPSPIQLAVIGCGYWGPNLVRNFARLEGCRIIQICDFQPGRLENIGRQFPDIPVTTASDQIFKDDRIEAVIIATPIETHYPLVKQALEAGKHVFVEKPLTHSAKTATEVLTLAEGRRLTLMAGHVFQYAPAVQRLKEIFEKEGFGKTLVYIASERMNFPPPQAKVDILWDLGPHDTSILLFFLGSRPRTVKTRGYTLNGGQLMDTALTELTFQNGLTALMHWNWHSPLKIRKMSFFGRGKMIVYDDGAKDPLSVITGHDNRSGLTAKESQTLTYGVQEVIHPPLERYTPLEKECAHFIDCVASRRRPWSGGDNALDVVRILEAASLSASRGGEEVLLS